MDKDAGVIAIFDPMVLTGVNSFIVLVELVAAVLAGPDGIVFTKLNIGVPI